MTSTAVVILNYNGEKLLPQFLPSVIDYSSPAKIIVVDNHSTDSSVSLLKEKFPQVELILFEKNLGFCGGYNIALAKVDAEIVVLLNSDVEVTKDWLVSPTRLLRSSDNIVAVQPKVLSYTRKDQFEYAGAGGGFIDTLGYPFCRGRIFQTIENDEGQYNDQTQVFWTSGACMIIKKEKFLEVGGFDNDFFAHMEEIDLCWRLNRKGYFVFYDGNSTVFHLGGGTLSVGSPRKVYFNFKNGLSILVKNLPSGELWYKLPIRILLDWAAALHFLLQGLGRCAVAVLRAHLHFLIDVATAFSKRRQGKLYGFQVQSKIVFGKALVFQYFLLGRKSFREIKNPR